MNDRQSEKRQMRRELLLFALGEAIVLAGTAGVFALLGRFSGKVLLGAAVGACLACLNYGLMALGVWAAADKAEAGDPAGGRKLITLSMLGRYLMMAAVLVIGAKTGLCDVIAMVVPLALSRVILFAVEYFRRKEG